VTGMRPSFQGRLPGKDYE